jgi:hypothetical protein
MPSASEDRGADPSSEALESVRALLPESDDEDLVEHRQGEPPEGLQKPLHDPWWAGGSGGGGI